MQSNSRYTNIDKPTQTFWLLNKRLPSLIMSTLKEISYIETEYKGYQVIVAGWHYEYQKIFNKNDELVTDSYLIEDSEIGRLGDKQTFNYYSAFGYEIGTDYDQVTELTWLGQYAVFACVFGGNTENNSLKTAKKRIDVLAKIKENIGTLIQISNDRARDVETIPYNAVVGDQVYFRAFGRYRRGLIIGTTGSRFIVGYVTPSNPKELKYKTISLADMRVGV
jgi:hypothetical protein